MTQLTIGQRIAAQRKLKGLSQEALAGQLELSRQAISKWESDAAIPEIDKLIALARIFGVSVGWLLGTERELSDDSLSDAQIQIVEEIVAKHQPRVWRWLAPALILFILAGAVLFGVHYEKQLQILASENADIHIQVSALTEGSLDIQSQITALTESNHTIQSQITGMNDLLEDQAEIDKLLTNLWILPYVSEDLENVQVDFYCVPKVFQESATAYISIFNPIAGIQEMLECTALGNYYWVRAELPPADGYQYAFLIVNESGYQEQIISSAKPYYSYCTDLYSSMHFHSDPASGARTNWNLSDSLYTYTTPVYTPMIPIYSSPYVGYEEILITLRHNGNAIWEQSFREAFREHAGAYMRSEEPLAPDIQVALPELSPGDTLTLVVTAKTYEGHFLVNTLESLEVVSDS